MYPSQPLKTIAEVNTETLPETTDPDWTFRYIDIGAVGRGELVADLVEMSFGAAPSRARRVIRAGDTIISSVRTYLRAVLPVDERLDGTVVSTGFAVARPVAVEPRFLAWVLQSDVFVEEVVARSTGVSYPAINPAELASVRVPVPLQSEQQRIARFLEEEIATVDDLIAAKQRMAALLDERLAAAIEEMLAPVGERTALLARFARIQSGLTIDAKNELLPGAEPYPYLRVANVQPGRVDLTEVKTALVEPSRAQRHRLRAGDVLMTEGGDIDKLGRGTVWAEQIEGCLHQNHVFAVRTDPHLLDPRFLALVTLSRAARTYFESTGVQSTNLASTSASKVLALPVPAVPLADQRRLVAAYEHERAATDRIVETLDDQIALLQERRRSLITAVVTGEMEVP